MWDWSTVVKNVNWMQRLGGSLFFHSTLAAGACECDFARHHDFLLMSWALDPKASHELGNPLPNDSDIEQFLAGDAPVCPGLTLAFGIFCAKAILEYPERVAHLALRLGVSGIVGVTKKFSEAVQAAAAAMLLYSFFMNSKFV